MTRLCRVLLPALCALVAAPPSAFAQERPPPKSSIAQYIETIPTGGGGAAVGHTGPGTPGSAAARRRIQELVQGAGPDAAALEAIATSEAYGAPPLDSPLRAGRALFREEHARPRNVTPADSLSAAVATFSGVGQARVAALLAALVLISASMLASARLRRR